MIISHADPPVLICETPADTRAAGAALAAVLVPPRAVALIGPLGAGKTVFCKGFAAGAAGVADDAVTSPTYNYLHLYEGRGPGARDSESPTAGRRVAHFDVFRLAGGADALLELGFADLLDGRTFALVEWADRARAVFDDDTVFVQFEAPDPGPATGADPAPRRLRFAPFAAAAAFTARLVAAGARTA